MKPETVSEALWTQVAAMTEDGHLRRLSGTFARFVSTLGAATPPLMVACVLLSELEGRGHSCLMLDELASDPATLMGWSDEQWSQLAQAAGTLPKHLKGWIAQLGACDQVWQVGDFDFDEPLVLDGERLYLRRYWRDETLVAQAVRSRARAVRPVDAPKARAWLDILFASERKSEPPDWQKFACAIALRGALAIITGGPGTGKTYTVARLLALLFAVAPDAAHQRVALAAPTGKAAARLKQSIDKALNDLADKVGEALPLRELTARMGAARTLHSLLGARPDTRSFAHHRGNPLDVDVLIVDEASMVHLEMMAALLDALPPHATLILLGDKDQLASVEAGAVLGDLCRDAQSGRYDAATVAYALAASGEAIAPHWHGDGGALAQQTVMLRQSRRFGGPIGQLALAVNAGDSARAHEILRGGGEAVRWIEHAHPHHVVQLAAEGYAPCLELVAAGPGALPHDAWVGAVLHRFEAFRVLCAVREGEWGVTGLNEVIEQRLGSMGLLRRRSEWYVGRPVMITRNDYGTRVFNGDIGLTLPDPARPGVLRVYFLEGDDVRSVLATRLRHVETAYAMTVHKSQGSEFRHTVLVLPRERGAMIARELIYTGITRASERFTLVSPGSAILAEAIARRTRRASGLQDMIGDSQGS
ncbi:exodeoxyribonuclease V subunit alpha [Massilia sp. PAMC28688]|uniref:exodeoxyribonuclease V subunit alpha n=1 Tax=Massilia sp. PAMC28688 TaxID=2861283 RepID=UPI001C629539|nr:exodeoxyribonuclease V subunit alpha [Massilia sp. PAMC28688]QYF92821.1 exodeoxyribonuclease V subunit alpha [Massilia sp. PAMC28688]